MNKRKITNEMLKAYLNSLIDQEKAYSTQAKYVHDIKDFLHFSTNKELTKTCILEYKEELSKKYAPASVNSKISSLNSFFSFCGWRDFRVKNIKIQNRFFLKAQSELTKDEYIILLNTAKESGQERLWLLMQTICSTGIRVSELKFITVEALAKGVADIDNKGKRRVVFLPDGLCKRLNEYVINVGIQNGAVFITKNGKPLDRSNVWFDMKKLCKSTGISPKKVFPHNLRHLFARTYYTSQHDIVRLADILGHSNINTTRIYTMENGATHKKQIQDLGLFL